MLQEKRTKISNIIKLCMAHSSGYDVCDSITNEPICYSIDYAIDQIEKVLNG